MNVLFGVLFITMFFFFISDSQEAKKKKKKKKKGGGIDLVLRGSWHIVMLSLVKIGIGFTDNDGTTRHRRPLATCPESQTPHALKYAAEMKDLHVK